jgi:hypothetical protein
MGEELAVELTGSLHVDLLYSTNLVIRILHSASIDRHLVNSYRPAPALHERVDEHEGIVGLLDNQQYTVDGRQADSRMIGPIKPTRKSGRFALSLSPFEDGKLERNCRAVSSICDRSGISEGPYTLSIRVTEP